MGNKIKTAEEIKKDREEFWAKVSAEVKYQAEHGMYQQPYGDNLTIRQAGTLGINYELYQRQKAINTRANRYGRKTSVSYIMMTKVIEYIDSMEAGLPESYLKQYGLSELVHACDDAFQAFFDKVKPLISAKEMELFSHDYEAFSANVDDYCNCYGYRDETEKEKKEAKRQRIKNLHLEIVNKGVEYKELYGEEDLKGLWKEIEEEQKERDRKEAEESKSKNS